MNRSADRQRLACLFAVLCVVVLCLIEPKSAWAGGDIPSTLHRTEYASPSGRYRLVVDPTHRWGEGPGHYRLARDGQEVWSGEHPFTLQQAAVADDGTAAGFAYPRGGDGEGPFAVAILGPRGDVRLREETPRKRSRYLHTASNPEGAGVILDSENDRLIVRISDPDLTRGLESWWVYRLSTTMPWKRLELKLESLNIRSFESVYGARSVPGTNLVLVNWGGYNPFTKRGGVFTLVDPEGRTVWRLNLPDDYQIPGGPGLDYRLWDELRERSAILNTSRPRRFTLRFVRAAQEVTFEASPTGDGNWDVKELGR